MLVAQAAAERLTLVGVDRPSAMDEGNLSSLG
jgi:hypothetical protein